MNQYLTGFYKNEDKSEIELRIVSLERNENESFEQAKERISKLNDFISFKLFPTIEEIKQWRKRND